MDDFFDWFFGSLDDTPRTPFGPPGPPFGMRPGAEPGTGPGAGRGPQSGPPSGPPPRMTPSLDGRIGARAVDPGSIRGCLFRFTYVMLNNGQRFWMWPVFVGRRSVAGYRWTGRRWVYFGIDLRRIASFSCF